MVAPIFKFKNVKVRLINNTPTFVYGVVPYINSIASQTLDSGVSVNEVSTVILTIQISNLTGYTVPTPAPATPAQTVNVSAFIQNTLVTSPTLPVFDNNVHRVLVYDYPLLSNNAFDPLNGNLVLSANDQLWIQCRSTVGASINGVDVNVSLLEIANATAS